MWKKTKTRQGSTGVEYGLIVGLIAVAILSVVGATGTQLADIFTQTKGTLEVSIQGEGYCPSGSYSGNGASYAVPDLPNGASGSYAVRTEVISNGTRQITAQTTCTDGVVTIGAENAPTYQCQAGTSLDEQGCYSFAWESSDWGACSQTCGTGTQTRTLACVRSDGVTKGAVPDIYAGCDSANMPSQSQSCTATTSCTYSAVNTTYALCSGYTCSSAGTKAVTGYECQRSDGVMVDNANCTAPAAQSCNPGCSTVLVQTSQCTPYSDGCCGGAGDSRPSTWYVSYRNPDWDTVTVSSTSAFSSTSCGVTGMYYYGPVKNAPY